MIMLLFNRVVSYLSDMILQSDEKAEITDMPIRPVVWGPPRPPEALG